MAQNSEKQICLTCPTMTNFRGKSVLGTASFFENARLVGIEINDGRRAGKFIELSLPAGVREEYRDGKCFYTDEQGRLLLSTKVGHDDHVTYAEVELLPSKG